MVKHAISANLEIERLKLSALLPDPANPRVHTKRQIRQIARSIEAFGYNVPILVDAENRVVAGHGRLEACKLLGWTEVPVIRLDHLNPSQAQAFLLADNKLTDHSTWDTKLLGERLRELAQLELTFSLEDTGFDMGEIDVLIEGLEEPQAGDDPADDLPEVQGEAVSRAGDRWALGPHRILCGNALEASSYEALLEGRIAQVVFTDPPYNVPIDGHVGGLGTVRHREFAMACGEMSEGEFTNFLTTVLGHLAAYSTDGSLHYVCMDWRHTRELLFAGQGPYEELKNLCVWVKDNAGMGSFYRSQHELVFVFKKGSAPHQNHVQLGSYGRYRSNVWRYAGVNSFGRDTEEGNLLELHPTVKPVALVADVLKDASRRGEIVLDAFLGSGTTLIAAEKTGRVCLALELDPLYVDTAIRRWERLTGGDAVLEATGETFKGREALRPGSEGVSHD